jgi:hypothetical protein
MSVAATIAVDMAAAGSNDEVVLGRPKNALRPR